ncbi:MAG: 50S ribosomal protein L4, partial [Acidimicrobiales bacterium]
MRASGAGTATAIHHDGAGRRLGRVGLDPATFGVVPNVAVMHQVVTAQLAAARSGTQSTLTRAEVRGGGSKPYRQKGTGRARQGSTRAPQWVGGGVAFGPKPRSYRQRTPKKMVALALRSALSDRAGEGRVAVVDRWAFPAPRTRDAVAALAAIGVSGRVLVVVGPEDGVARKSFANLPAVHVLPASELNAYDVLRSDWVVFTEETLPGGSQWVAATGSPAATPSGAADSPDGEISAAPEAGAGVPDGSPTA